MELLGLAGDARFASFASRPQHRDELDDAVAQWIQARPFEEVMRAFEDAHAAIAPVYTMRELLRDPHVVARGTFPAVDGIIMQGAVARLSRTPAELRWAGRPLGADTADVERELESS